MLVDDEAVFVESTSAALVRDGAYVATAGTLEEARRLIRGGAPFDVVLLDLTLPDGSGLELLRELRQTDRTSGIVVMASELDAATHAACRNEGVSWVLLKPVAGPELISVVRSEVPRARHWRALETRHGGRSPRATERELSDGAIEKYARGRGLKGRVRDAFTLVMQGFTYADVGRQLNIKERTVKAHMAKAREISGATLVQMKSAILQIDAAKASKSGSKSNESEE